MKEMRYSLIFTVAIYLPDLQKNKLHFMPALAENYDIPAIDFKIPNDWPIYYVSFFDAINFCNWLSVRDNLEPVYDIKQEDRKTACLWDKTKNGYRLPTEAEWEFAASSGGVDKFEDLNDYAWFSLDFFKGHPHSVGTKNPNSFGLCDMLGNVAEWCWDLYNENYYLSKGTNNPLGPTSGYNSDKAYESSSSISYTDRVVRGGTYNSDNPTTYMRWGMFPNSTNLSIIGFRVARNFIDE